MSEPGFTSEVMKVLMTGVIRAVSLADIMWAKWREKSIDDNVMKMNECWGRPRDYVADKVSKTVCTRSEIVSVTGNVEKLVQRYESVIPQTLDGEMNKSENKVNSTTMTPIRRMLNGDTVCSTKFVTKSSVEEKKRLFCDILTEGRPNRIPTKVTKTNVRRTETPKSKKKIKKIGCVTPGKWMRDNIVSDLEQSVVTPGKMTENINIGRIYNEDIKEDDRDYPNKKIVQTCTNDVPEDQDTAKMTTSSHNKGVGGARKKTKTEVMLINTARKLKLKKISTMFDTIPVGATSIGMKPETNSNFGQTSEAIGVSWVGEKCTVQLAKAKCDDQSEGAVQEWPKRHLRFEGSLDCDWPGGGELGEKDRT